MGGQSRVAWEGCGACLACYTRTVPTLNHAITAALREVELSLTHQHEKGTFPVGLERVQLTLTFALDGDGTANASPGGPHSLTISFKPGELTARAETSPAPPAASLPSPATDAAGLRACADGYSRRTGGAATGGRSFACAAFTAWHISDR